MAYTMNLHTHTKDFTALITFAAAHFNITPAFVEKDYWITLALTQLGTFIPPQHQNHPNFWGIEKCNCRTYSHL
ncbi:MAG: hypothetical protein LBR26_07035 [Prevotella sp.]|jgi:hypothetical protein|nr:hypothetical protein [Prevotella sp.]